MIYIISPTKFLMLDVNASNATTIWELLRREHGFSSLSLHASTAVVNCRKFQYTETGFVGGKDVW